MPQVSGTCVGGPKNHADRARQLPQDDFMCTPTTDSVAQIGIEFPASIPIVARRSVLRSTEFLKNTVGNLLCLLDVSFLHQQRDLLLQALNDGLGVPALLPPPRGRGFDPLHLALHVERRLVVRSGFRHEWFAREEPSLGGDGFVAEGAPFETRRQV